ncbi:MAG: YtxH domain-containing protein [Candidatus Sericytochromatia bacterium]
MKELENEKQESSLSAFFIGALIGGFAGTLAGILLAPKSGIELRNQLSENVSDSQSKAWQMIGNAKTSISQSVDSASKNIESTVTRVVDAFNAGAKAAKGTIQEENIAKLEKNNISDKITEVKSEDIKLVNDSEKVNEKNDFS